MNSRSTFNRRRGGALRRLGWFAAASLLAISVFAPTASAAEEPGDECATNLFEYSADGGAWRPVVVNDAPSPYPMITVTVRAIGELPDGCSRAFSLASYDTEGGSWPESGVQTFLDHDTATLDAQNPSATLTVTGPECFGQTDFYTSAWVNDVFWPGWTRYDGIDGPLPHYPDSPTPYGKIAGSEGGHECVAPTPPPTPTATPTSTPSEPGVGSIEIFKIDNKGTPPFEDDEFLDGASFALYLDNGDGLFSEVTDTLAGGPAEAVDGILTFEDLAAGSYWIVETIVPAGFTGSDPMLIELNVDPALVCIWDRTGLLSCEAAKDGGPLDIVFVDNTPDDDPEPNPTGSDLPVSSDRPTPSSGVGGATGTPGVTPPSTDTISAGSNSTGGGGWRLVLAGLALLIAVALVFTQPARIRRTH